MAHCDEIWQSLWLAIDPQNHFFHACFQELQGTLERIYNNVELLIRHTEDSPGVVVVVVEAGDEDTEREGTETVVEEPVEDSAAVEEHERDGG